jgi:hypothetical protein
MIETISSLLVIPSLLIRTGKSFPISSSLSVAKRFSGGREREREREREKSLLAWDDSIQQG